jgi:hypothetical protein
MVVKPFIMQNTLYSRSFVFLIFRVSTFILKSLRFAHTVCAFRIILTINSLCLPFKAY